MRWVCGLALVGHLALAGVAAAEPVNLKVQRLDDSRIDAFVDRSDGAEQVGLVLMLQGSLCESVSPATDNRFPLTLPPGTVRLDIEKYGITPETQDETGEHCPADYLAHNTIDGRVMDVLTVIADLRANAPWWNGELYVSGVSEGATVAAIVAALIPETRGAILINGSVGRPFSDGWAEAVVESVRVEGGDAAAQAEARRGVADAWSRARATPTTETYEGAGNTLRWWASIIDLRPVNLLVNVEAPILLIQSERDQMTPVASARAVVDRFRAAGRTNLTYRELEGLDHGFRDAAGEPRYGPVLDLINGALADQVRAPPLSR